MTEKLNPSEAQRKAMAQRLRECGEYGVFRTVDEIIAAANSIPEGAPVGTIARRPDGTQVAVRSVDQEGLSYWSYNYLTQDEPTSFDDDEADYWPVIYDPTRRHARKVREAIESWRDSHPGDESTVAFLVEVVEDLLAESDPTAQQEPAESAFRSAGMTFETGPRPDLTTAPKPPTPRVVDRLGVEEQGSRWLDVFGWVWSFENGWWKTKNGSLDYGCVDPSIRGPFKEILEPRVLPSLDCKEARDGTVWEARYVLLAGREQTPGWKFQHTQDGWVYEDGSRVLSPEFLTGRGPYTEVLGDPS